MRYEIIVTAKSRSKYAVTINHRSTYIQPRLRLIMRLHWGIIKEKNGNRTYERVILARSEEGLLAKSWDGINNRFKVIHQQDQMDWNDLDDDDADRMADICCYVENILKGEEGMYADGGKSKTTPEIINLRYSSIPHEAKMIVTKVSRHYYDLRDWPTIYKYRFKFVHSYISTLD